MVDKTKKHRASGVLKGHYVTVGIKQNGTVVERLKLRRIQYLSQDGKKYVFITNNFTLPAKQIATIYKNRWTNEMLFKQIKQNFPLKYFWGERPNAMKMQVYCVLIAQLLMIVIRKKAATKKSFANMITVTRIHLMSYAGLLEFIEDTYKIWRKMNEPPLAFSP
jgi:IS4 transposase